VGEIQPPRRTMDSFNASFFIADASSDERTVADAGGHERKTRFFNYCSCLTGLLNIIFKPEAHSTTMPNISREKTTLTIKSERLGTSDGWFEKVAENWKKQLDPTDFSGTCFRT
jgi:hypothetical protein